MKHCKQYLGNPDGLKLVVSSGFSICLMITRSRVQTKSKKRRFFMPVLSEEFRNFIRYRGTGVICRQGWVWLLGGGGIIFQGYAFLTLKNAGHKRALLCSKFKIISGLLEIFALIEVLRKKVLQDN